MTPLKKYIRPKVLQGFLGKAAALAGRDCALAIDYEGEVVLVEGGGSTEEFGGDRADVLRAPLQFDAGHRGRLLLRLPAGSNGADRGRYEQILSFTAYSIQELMDMERARRSIADEALAKYRELALLHRSVPAINTSLRMRDVVGALI
ncbi:MAG: metal-dependent phosphohydrolase, partial [Pseudodesulfovibrio sp.]